MMKDEDRGKLRPVEPRLKTQTGLRLDSTWLALRTGDVVTFGTSSLPLC